MVVVEAEGDGKWSSCSHNVAEEEDRGNSKAEEEGGGEDGGGYCLVFCNC